MFYLAGIVIAFFLTFILVSKKNKSSADKWLAWWLGTSGIHLVFFYFYLTGKYTEFPYYLGLDLPMPLLPGPFLFLYTLEQTNQRTNKFPSFLHFIPFAIFTLLLSPFTLSPLEHKIEIYRQEGIGYESILFPLSIAVMLSGIIYAGLSLRLLALHQRNIRDVFSSTDKINLHWIAYLILGIFIIWTIVIFGSDQMTFAAVVVFLFFIGYFGIKQVGIFTNQSIIQVEQEEVKSADEINIKYARSGVETDELIRIHDTLKLKMYEFKYFKNPELTLAQLSNEIEVHPNVLSQVINSLENQSFFDYINFLRVEEFKTLIVKNVHDQFTLIALAYECGFNSKTSFNRNFKKVTGLSPTDFIKESKIPVSA